MLRFLPFVGVCIFGSSFHKVCMLLQLQVLTTPRWECTGVLILVEFMCQCGPAEKRSCSLSFLKQTLGVIHLVERLVILLCRVDSIFL